MNNIEMSYEDFLKIINRPTNFKFESKIKSNVYAFLQEYPYQGSTYDIVGHTDFTAEEIEEYTKFGIFFEGYNKIQQREYVIYSDTVENISNTIHYFIPEGKTPDFYFISRPYNSFSDYDSDLQAMRELYPNIKCLNYYDQLVEEHRKQLVINSYLEQYEGVCDAFLNISDYVYKFDEQIRVNNTRTFELFKTYCDDIANKCTPTTLVYSAELDDLYNIFALQLSYFYNIKVLVPTYRYNNFTESFMSLAFSRDYMPVHAQFDYITDFPSITVRVNDLGDFLCFTSNADVELDLLKYNTVTGNIEKYSGILSELSYVNLFDIFKVDSKDLDTARNHASSLSKLFREFEGSCEDRILCNICNTFVFYDNGDLCLANIKDFRLKTNTAIVNISDDGVPIVTTCLTVNDLGSLIPWELIYNSGFLGDKIVKYAVECGISPANFKQMIKYRDESALVYRNLPRYKGIEMADFDESTFLSLGLNWNECVSARTTLNGVLLKYLNPSKQSEYLNIFGGYHPLLDNKLIISEKTLR